jgi:hypothetical protein
LLTNQTTKKVGGLRNRTVAFLNAASKGAEEAPEGQIPVTEEAEAESESE